MDLNAFQNDAGNADFDEEEYEQPQYDENGELQVHVTNP